MEQTRASVIRVLLVALGVALVVGCGNPGEDLSPEADEVDELAHLDAAELTGMTVALFRQSDRCVPLSRVGIDAAVGDDIEFVSEEVGALDAPCDGSPSPAVDVFLVDGSVIFDFQNVKASGAFPSGGFDGFELVIRRACGDPVVAAATVDAAPSNMEMPLGRVEAHLDLVRFNLAGMAYDQDSFLKVDLRVVDLGCTVL
ncbi:MAG: hypothetical protein AAF500_19385 [Myxococcota bacterium]